MFLLQLFILLINGEKKFLRKKQKIFVKDIDQAAISFTTTIHSLIDYQLDRKSAGNKFNEDILDNYICWFSTEFGGKDEENID